MLPQHRSFCAPSAYEFREPAFAGSLSEKEPNMTFGRIARIAVLASLVIFLSVFLASSGSRPPAEARPQFSGGGNNRSEEHTSELQSRLHLVCRLLLEKKKNVHPISASSADRWAAFIPITPSTIGVHL